MKTSLDNFELAFYFAVWSSSNFFSLYHLFRIQEDIRPYVNETDIPDLKKGWPVLGRYKDESDAEWLTWKRYIEISWLPLIIHFLGSETLRNFNKFLVKFWHIIFTLCFIFIKFGIIHVLLMITQPILYVLAMSVGRKNTPVVWTLSIILLVSVNSLKSSELLWWLAESTPATDEDVYLLFISLGWTQVRCASFSFDLIQKRKNCKTQKIADDRMYEDTISIFTDILSYSFYFPTFLMGPIVMYSDFENSFIERNTPIWTRLKRFLFNIALIVVYTYLMDIALHFIYFFALQNEIKYIRMLPSMALCGAGLWMGVQFHLKYVVMYGTSGAFAALDGVRAPPTPRCIARVHLYSHMWKHFDVGLYRFLIKYIYKPILAGMPLQGDNYVTIRKLIASLATFIFILLWHGTMPSIFIWSALNFIGITLETIGGIIEKTVFFSQFKKHILRTARMEERFKAFISTPLLIMSALSNFYLFAGYEVGNIFVERFFSESWYNILFIYFCLYTCCNVSAVLSDVPSRTARYN